MVLYVMIHMKYYMFRIRVKTHIIHLFSRYKEVDKIGKFWTGSVETQPEWRDKAYILVS